MTCTQATRFFVCMFKPIYLVFALLGVIPQLHNVASESSSMFARSTLSFRISFSTHSRVSTGPDDRGTARDAAGLAPHAVQRTRRSPTWRIARGLTRAGLTCAVASLTWGGSGARWLLQRGGPGGPGQNTETGRCLVLAVAHVSGIIWEVPRRRSCEREGLTTDWLTMATSSFSQKSPIWSQLQQLFLLLRPGAWLLLAGQSLSLFFFGVVAKCTLRWADAQTRSHLG